MVDFVDFPESRPSWIQLCRQCVPGFRHKTDNRGARSNLDVCWHFCCCCYVVNWNGWINTRCFVSVVLESTHTTAATTAAVACQRDRTPHASGFCTFLLHPARMISFHLTIHACSQPSDNGGGAFFSDFGPFSCFENWSSQWLSKIIIDDVTLWSKLEYTWLVSLYSILLILFHKQTIFKMLALEQSGEKWPFSAVWLSDRFDLLIPLWSSVFILVPHTEYV